MKKENKEILVNKNHILDLQNKHIKFARVNQFEELDRYIQEPLSINIENGCENILDKVSSWREQLLRKNHSMQKSWNKKKIKKIVRFAKKEFTSRQFSVFCLMLEGEGVVKICHMLRLSQARVSQLWKACIKKICIYFRGIDD